MRKRGIVCLVVIREWLKIFLLKLASIILLISVCKLR